MSRAKDSQQEIQTRLERRFEQVLSPFQRFIQDQTTSSMMLIICTLVALLIANSEFSELYDQVVEMELGLLLGGEQFAMSLHHWINDALMALFFFLLGLEIKRELLAGELRDMRRTLPVIAAAFGGMLVPALLFTSLNLGLETVHGWGVPMATDTAFAVGILALLRGRIPDTAFIFLTALAIFDDLGAILVIALFYTESLNLQFLGMSGGVVALLILANAAGIRNPWFYFAFGGVVWLLFYQSGVHATVAGIVVAMTVPARPKRETDWFMRRAYRLMRRFEHMERQRYSGASMLGDATRHGIVEGVQQAAEKATTPLRRWERALEQPVGLFVLPLFALVNAGIPISWDIVPTIWQDRLAGGVVLGLVVGKGLGIPLLAWLALRLNLGHLPEGLSMRHIVGIGLLGGMGFTMSIFIANLGFATTDQLVAAKSGILVASLLAGVLGWAWLRFLCPDERERIDGSATD